MMIFLCSYKKQQGPKQKTITIILVLSVNRARVYWLILSKEP